MISFFRRFFQSKIGLPIVLAFLALMALAFAASDITGSTFGGVSNTDRVAVVGGEGVPAPDLTLAANNALEQVRAQNPTLTMPEFIAEGALDEVMRQLTATTPLRLTVPVQGASIELPIPPFVVEEWRKVAQSSPSGG